MRRLQMARGALIGAALLLLAAPALAGWTSTVVPDVAALASVGDRLFVFSYQTGGMPKLTAQALDIATGVRQWDIALDHMRPDMPHVEAVTLGDSVYATVGDPTDAASGYLLSLSREVSTFILLHPRPGERPGVAVTRQTLWTTVGGAGRPVRWRGLNASHTRFGRSLGSGGASGCVGRPALVRSWLVLPERGGLAIAPARGAGRERFARVGTCTWGEPVPIGRAVAVMSTAKEKGPMIVAAVDPTTRKVLWRVPAPANPSGARYVPTLTASGGSLFATYAHEGLVIDAAGHVTRRVPLEGVTLARAGTGGRVVCALASRRVVVVDLLAGRTRELATMQEPIGALHLARGHVYAGAGETVRDLGPL